MISYRYFSTLEKNIRNCRATFFFSNLLASDLLTRAVLQQKPTLREKIQISSLALLASVTWRESKRPQCHLDVLQNVYRYSGTTWTKRERNPLMPYMRLTQKEQLLSSRQAQSDPPKTRSCFFTQRMKLKGHLSTVHALGKARAMFHNLRSHCSTLPQGKNASSVFLTFWRQATTNFYKKQYWQQLLSPPQSRNHVRLPQTRELQRRHDKTLIIS